MPRPTATTTWLSGHRQFPDDFYELHQSGRMDWDVTGDVLALQGRIGGVRNAGVVCVRSQVTPELGRLGCAYGVTFDVDATGAVRLVDTLPLLALTTNGLQLDVSLSLPGSASAAFDFGDGTGLQDQTALPHTYGRPGPYEVLVRLVDGGRLTEYRAAVVVSGQHQMLDPCVAVPDLQLALAANHLELTPVLVSAAGESLGVTWRLDGASPDMTTGSPLFRIDPGRHVLHLTASRPLTARLYARQLHLPDQDLSMDRLRLVSNRTFDITTGADTTANPNQVTQHLFAGEALSPVDRWTFELPMASNPAIVSVTPTDQQTCDLGEVADAFLVLEYGVS